MKNKNFLISLDQIEHKILLLRGQKVMMDSDLAYLYGVKTKALIQGVKRNQARFPNDFMFKLNFQELSALRSQFVTSKQKGGRRYLPYVFTEQGVAMLSSVLKSKRAVQVNIEVMRAFVKMRRFLISHEELSRKIENLEAKYDKNFKQIFEAIRLLMIPEEKSKNKIGFSTEK